MKIFNQFADELSEKFGKLALDIKEAVKHTNAKTASHDKISHDEKEHMKDKVSKNADKDEDKDEDDEKDEKPTIHDKSKIHKKSV